MADIVVGIAILLLGLGVAFFGLCLFLIMLPIWGFLASFFVGAGSIEAFFGDGFLSTVGGWIAGFVTGILFAPLVSHLFWYAGVLITVASNGALFGSGLMAIFGVETDWIVALVAVIVGALFTVAAILLNFRRSTSSWSTPRLRVRPRRSPPRS